MKQLSANEYNDLPREQQREYVNELNREDDEREKERRRPATAQDVLDSFEKLQPIMNEMPDPATLPIFAENLLADGISKWELQVATRELIRSVAKVTCVADYFKAITRVKIKQAGINQDIWNEKALDF